MRDLNVTQYQPETVEQARDLMPTWKTVNEAVDLITEEFPTHRILRERCYLTVYQVCCDNSYADYILQIARCPSCRLIMYGRPEEYCPKCGEYSDHFEDIEQRRCATQDDFLTMMEDKVGMRRATSFNRVQTYKRLVNGLGWSDEMAFAYHLWSSDTPRAILSSLGKWSRDGQLEVVNRPHRLPGIDKEKIVEALSAIDLVGDDPDLEDLDAAMDIAIEMMNEDGVVAEVVHALTDLAKESLSQEIGSLIELRPQDAKQRVKEDLLGQGHLEWWLFRDETGALYLGLSYFQRFRDPDGILCERGRVDKAESLGVLPSWVENLLMRRLKRSILDSPPQRFRSIF